MRLIGRQWNQTNAMPIAAVGELLSELSQFLKISSTDLGRVYQMPIRC
jgi:hypothetical protein